MAELPNWPVSLPCALIEGFSVAPARPNVIHSQPDSGPVRRRRRFTAVSRPVTCVLSLSRSQMQTLEHFIEITLADVGNFRWIDFRRPLIGVNNAVYVFNSHPAYAPSGTGNRWRASLDIELLTTADGRFLLDVSDGTTGLTNT